LAFAHKRPPCDSIILRLMESPIPVPCGLVVKKGPQPELLHDYILDKSNP
jgi:hypothetical protein